MGCDVASDLAVSLRLEADGVLAMASELAAHGVCIALDVALSNQGMGADVSGVAPVVVWPLVAPGAMVKGWMLYSNKVDCFAIVFAAACTSLVYR